MPAPAVLWLVAGLLGAPMASAVHDTTTAAPDAVRDAVRDSVPGQQPPVFDASRFDSLTAVGLRVLLDSATAEGIPTGPLINRALEGAARRVPGARILQVVRAHAVALVQAREALGPGTPVMELDAGATALRAGVDSRSLVAIRGTRAAGAAMIPIVVLTDIVQRGIPAVTARDAVTTIARQPASDDLLKGLQLTVARNAVRGPGMAADALARYLRGTVNGVLPSSAPATTDRKPIRPPVP